MACLTTRQRDYFGFVHTRRHTLVQTEARRDCCLGARMAMGKPSAQVLTPNRHEWKVGEAEGIRAHRFNGATKHIPGRQCSVIGQ